MAVTTHEFPLGHEDWYVTAQSDDASGVEQIFAAPGAGEAIEVEWLYVNNGDTAQEITVGGTEAGGAVDKPFIDQWEFDAYDCYEFRPPASIRLLPAAALVFMSESAVPVSICVRLKVVGV